MDFDKQIKKYAELAVKIGVNIQKGQLLVINADVECAWFVSYVVQAAYEAQAGDVVVNWKDGHVEKLRYLYADEAYLKVKEDWLIARHQYYIDQGAAFLSISSSHPTLYQEVDSDKLKLVQTVRAEVEQALRAYTSANLGQWSVVLIPNREWAQMVYPNLSEKQALAKLWETLFAICQVQADNDPVAAWRKHTARIVAIGEKLNAYQLKSLHFKNSRGTDLIVELVANHSWEGGREITPKGIAFVPNIPTEEIFCMPHRERVNGMVYATKPLNIQGKLVEDFWFRFKDGAVVDFGAKKNESSLANLLSMDEGAKHLGEVALVSYDTPISLTQTLFYNGLIDENAACHLALGNCYPYNIVGGSQKSQAELSALGANFSLVHCDFMFGSQDLSCIGTTSDDQEVVIFADGRFTI